VNHVLELPGTPGPAWTREAWTRLLWKHPEWWTLGLSASAWLTLLADGTGTAGERAAAMHHHAGGALTVLPPGFARAMLTWLLMIGAMMFPLVVDAVRTTAARSLWPRRNRAITVFLLGYLLVWLVAGAAIAAAAQALAGTLARLSLLSSLSAAGFTLAALWQLTPIKRRALRGCHRTLPLAPRGWRADGDAVRYGLAIGGRCVASCWALMLACTLAGHATPAMLCTAAVAAAERFMPRLDRRLTAAALCIFGSASVNL
jgi:predicted metal-binding membrane protein